MKCIKPTAGLLLFLMMCLPAFVFAIDPTDTRMLAQPAISANHIAFIYAEDLWVANKDGSQPRRLTVDEGLKPALLFLRMEKQLPSVRSMMAMWMYLQFR